MMLYIFIALCVLFVVGFFLFRWVNKYEQYEIPDDGGVEHPLKEQ